LESRITTLEGTNRVLASQVVALRAELQSEYYLQEQINALEIEMFDLHEQISMLQYRDINHLNEISELRSELLSKSYLQGQISTLETERSNLQAQISTLQNQNRSLQNEISDLRSELQTEFYLHEQIAELEFEYEKMQSQILELLSDLQSLQSEQRALVLSEIAFRLNFAMGVMFAVIIYLSARLFIALRNYFKLRNHFINKAGLLYNYIVWPFQLQYNCKRLRKHNEANSILNYIESSKTDKENKAVLFQIAERYIRLIYLCNKIESLITKKHSEKPVFDDEKTKLYVDTLKEYVNTSAKKIIEKMEIDDAILTDLQCLCLSEDLDSQYNNIQKKQKETLFVNRDSLNRYIYKLNKTLVDMSELDGSNSDKEEQVLKDLNNIVSEMKMITI